MKKIITVVALSLIVCGMQAQTVNNIRIIDARRFHEPTVNMNNADVQATRRADLARHKNHEVNVYHNVMGYQVNYFQDENNAIVMHSFSVGEAGLYDKASYSWSKDTLNIQLANAIGKTKIYKGYGWGATNSMKLD